MGFFGIGDGVTVTDTDEHVVELVLYQLVRDFFAVEQRGDLAQGAGYAHLFLQTAFCG